MIGQPGMAAIAARGEAVAAGFKLRPTFAALSAAEEELGPLFGLVERAASGQLKLSEMTTLFWHCRALNDPEISGISREYFCEAIVAGGLAASTPALKILLGQILGGQ